MCNGPCLNVLDVTDNSSCAVDNGGCEGNCTALTVRRGYRCSCPSGLLVSVAHPKSCVGMCLSHLVSVPYSYLDSLHIRAEFTATEKYI